MKQKDKLAKEMRATSLDSGMDEKAAYFYGFLHGFDKCREMAQEIVERHMEGKQYNIGCMECGVAIAMMGEEEVPLTNFTVGHVEEYGSGESLGEAEVVSVDTKHGTITVGSKP